MYARDHALIATPIGPIRIEGDESGLSAIAIGADGPRAAGTTAPVRAAAEQITAWFAGTIRDFDVALHPALTPRGEALRQGMVAIRYGETQSYGELAAHLGSSPRAVGQACARNPFPLIVPCHRVLGAGGALGSYSAGDGPATKSWLLEHERRHSGATLL
jgi:methylated-DNA-[protein]-cysteine S-methyltransferase